MAINLSKGQKIDLTKTNPGLSKITVGLGWDTNKYDGGKDFDLDVSVFLANAEGKVESDKNFVFFNNPQNENGSVVHTGITAQVMATEMTSKLKLIWVACQLTLKRSLLRLQSMKHKNAAKTLDKCPVLTLVS